MKDRLWRRALLTLLPALVIGATTATVIGPGVASATLSTFTVPAQTPSPVTAGGTASYRDHHHGLGRFERSLGHLGAASGLRHGRGFVRYGRRLRRGQRQRRLHVHARSGDHEQRRRHRRARFVHHHGATRWDNSGCTTRMDSSPLVAAPSSIADGPDRHHQRGHQRHRHAATLNGTVNAEGASTAVTFCYSTSSTIGNCTGTVTTVNGSTPTVTGTTNTAETAALTGLTPNTDLLLQHQGGQQRRHRLWHGHQFHDHVGPDRRHERGHRRPRPRPRPSTARSTPRTPRPRSASVTAPRARPNCSGATTVNGHPGHGHGDHEHLRERRAQRPGAGHRVLLPDRGDQQRRHHLWLGAQLHHLGRGPSCHARARRPASPARTATLNGTVNAEGASTAVTFCYSTSSTIWELHGDRHHRERLHHPADGHHDHRRDGGAHRPDAQHRLLLQHQGGQQRRHRLWHGDQLHDRLGPGRHHERGHRHHRHDLDPQRHGQRRERLDRGQLLLQHLEPDRTARAPRP